MIDLDDLKRLVETGFPHTVSDKRFVVEEAKLVSKLLSLFSCCDRAATRSPG